MLTSTINRYVYASIRNLPPFFQHKTRVVWSKVELVSNNLDLENPAVRGMLEYFNKHDVGYEIHHQGDLPARSGMGSSSAFIVGLLNAHAALTGLRSSRAVSHEFAESLAKTAIRIEREFVGDTVGIQDQYASALGGVRLLEIDQAGEVYPRGCFIDKCDKLNDNLVLFFMGTTRHASEIAKAQVAEIGEHRDAMEQLREQAHHGYRILTGGAPMGDCPLLLKEAWQIKRRLSPVISSSRIDRMVDGLLANGADAAKIIGAGGGGFVLTYCRTHNRDSLIEWAKWGGLIYVDFKFTYKGSEVIFDDSET